MIELKREFPKQTNDKNDLFIGILAWPSNNCDVIAITKGDIYLEYPLNNHFFGDLNEDFFENIGVIPTNNTCSNCREFAIFIDANEKCMDCKVEIQ
ncbi:hypothetical protein [Oceanobacillus luteolus]|uniref:Uncharacterized protein n=1 Tax=Oceanobacillus luteolus TaxID=1274358 RepID=A0ABW4HSJ0_9BACI